MHCDELSDLLEAYLEERLDDPRRRQLREHLRACPRCRGAALDRDPTLLLACSAPAAADPARAEAVAAAVMAQIHGRRLERQLGRRRQPWLAAAAAALVMVGGAAAWRMVAGDPSGAAPEAPVAMGASLEAQPPRAEVDMAGAGVRVYQFADQSGHPDQAVYYVVNPALES